jgi:c-di-GMP-binding flagellar brake protein YcgR
MPGVPEVFFSAILSINPENEYILLDEINSRHGHELLQIHKKMNVVTKINGIEIRFSANLINTSHQDGAAIYKIEYPESIHYLQKRQNYRINIGLGINIPIKLKREDGIPVYGHMINLSETGAGIDLDTPCSIHIGEILPHCELRISEDNIIKCQLEIRYLNQNKSNHVQRIGGLFIGLDGSQQRELSKLVIELQRDLMKRLPKDGP